MHVLLILLFAVATYCIAVAVADSVALPIVHRYQHGHRFESLVAKLGWRVVIVVIVTVVVIVSAVVLITMCEPMQSMTRWLLYLLCLFDSRDRMMRPVANFMAMA